MIIGVERYRQFITSTVLAAAVSVVWIGSCSAQTQDSTAHEQSPAENESAAEASKQAANPLASVWLMQFQQNNTWIGMPASVENRVQSNLQFQPLMSLKLTDDWSLVTGPVVTLFNTTPFQDQAGKDMRVTAFGDTTLALAVSPGHRLVGNWLLAAGPTFVFPTATDSRIGQDKWQVGPAAAVGYVGKNFVTYVFPQQRFSVGGNGPRTRQMLLIYAFVYTLPKGWTVGTNPNMFVDWEASSGNKVTFPVGFRVGATVEKYGGRFVVLCGRVNHKEGDWQPRLVVMLEFPSLEQAERWYNSSEYKPLIAMREKAARTQLIIAEGT